MISVSVASIEVSDLKGLDWRSVFWKTDWHEVSFLTNFCSFAVMDVQAFERLLGPCMDIMKRNITHYEEQLVAMFGSSMDLLDPGN